MLVVLVVLDGIDELVELLSDELAGAVVVVLLSVAGMLGVVVVVVLVALLSAGCVADVEPCMEPVLVCAET